MKKIIKRNIRISTRTRDFVDYVNHEFYSHDKHNAFFEFTMERLPTENIIGLFYFQKTKRYLEKRATVEGNTFTIEFDTNLITTDETVIGFIYFEKVVQSADVHQFSFGVKVSEIDKMQDVPIQEETTKRIVSLEDIVTKAELKELFKNIERTGGSTPIDTSNFATKKDLEDLRNNQPVVDTSNFVTNAKVEEVENRVLALETKEDKDTIYNDEDVKRRISQLESKTDNFISSVSVNKEGNNVTLTYNYVDGQSKNVSFTDSDTINVAYDDSALVERLKTLENRPQVDLTKLVNKDELPNLIQHQSLEEYAKKTEIPHINTENFATKQDLDEIRGSQPTVGNHDFATTESVTAVSKNVEEQAKKITALETKAGYEIHGTGMPNGQVEAPIGTTYVDTAVTNGALKWIKQNGTGNTGWKVLIGDTGWRTLNSVSKLGNSFIKIRRVNNLVTYNFGGLQWGWFGIVRRNGPGFVRHNSTGDRGAKVLGPGSILEGFRSESSLVGGIYSDSGKPYGIWYLGGKSDSNYIQFSFNDPIPTDRDIGDIRVSAISYITDEDWPVTLPQK
jgi:hypothetical protein